MDIEKANYDTIIRFGTLDDLKVKLKTQEITIEKIINTIDQSGFFSFRKCISESKI